MPPAGLELGELAPQPANRLARLVGRNVRHGRPRREPSMKAIPTITLTYTKLDRLSIPNARERAGITGIF